MTPASAHRENRTRAYALASTVRRPRPAEADAPPPLIDLERITVEFDEAAEAAMK
jgi:hypothetical protein